MTGWVLWVIAACAFGVGEMLTRGLFLAPLALGAVLAAIVDLAGAGGAGAWIAFVVSSLIGLGVVRSVARSEAQVVSQVRVASEALIGKEAIVLERIANSEGVGCAKIDGEVWTARAFDDAQVIERGTRVEVVEIKGATALVTADGPGQAAVGSMPMRTP